MLLAQGRTAQSYEVADRYGPLPLAYGIVFVTGIWLFSAQTMVDGRRERYGG